jgi:hypothetical protein
MHFKMNRSMMKMRPLRALAVAAMVVALAIAWMRGAFAGKPTLGLAGRDGISRQFPVGEADSIIAVTNAFDLFKYKGMLLEEAVGSDYLAENWHPTNGFLLDPQKAIAQVSMKGLFGHRTVPYMAWFHITITPLTSNRTDITVKTVVAKILDGLALGHGGTTKRTVRVPAIRQDVMKAIEAEIAKRYGHSLDERRDE